MVAYHPHPDRPFLTGLMRNTRALTWVGVLAGFAMAALTILYAYGTVAA
jgi:hypothetical protein